MPPKSDYWKYFLVQGILAVCQISGCPKPNVSLGPEAKPGQKKDGRKPKSNARKGIKKGVKPGGAFQHGIEVGNRSMKVSINS